MRLCELRQKEIITPAPAKPRLSYRSGVDRTTGAKCPDRPVSPLNFVFSLVRDNEYVLSWNCICQIGDDIILVKIQEENKP